MGKNPKSTIEHNHRTILNRLVRKGEIHIEDIENSEMIVYHDDWCGFPHGRRCHCKPRIELRGEVIYGE